MAIFSPYLHLDIICPRTHKANAPSQICSSSATGPAHPPSELAPPVMAALHPPAAATAQVHAAAELHTGDLRALRGIELHKDDLDSSRQQGYIALKAHVASVSFKCFSCFRDMLQGFRTDVAYVAVAVHLCCKRLFPMSHMFFRRTLQMCLSGCCICFMHILQMF
jgi:hypothetical protein